jgi:hypothetical protein
MAKLSQLLKPHVSIVVPVSGAEGKDVPTTVKANPNAYTGKTEIALREAIEANRVSETVADLAAALIAEWDVTDDDGKALPPTRETFLMMPVALLSAIMGGVQNGLSGNAPKE